MPKHPQTLDKSIPPVENKRASLNPDACESASDRVLGSCKNYLFGQSTSVENAFASHKNDFLLIGVDTRRYMLHQLTNDGEAGLEFPTGLYSLKDLLSSELRKPNPVIGDLLHEGDTLLVGGRPKVGKSRLVHQMILNLSHATPFLGMPVPRQRRVLLIDLENKPWSIKDRLVRMARPDSLAIASAFVWCVDSLAENTLNSKPEGIEKLHALLDQTDAEVLVIDPWRLWLGSEENSSEEVVKGLIALSQLRKSRSTLAIVIVHHVRKERFESPARLMRDPSLWIENISGHHALVSHVDACFGLDRQEHDGEEVLVFGGVARNVEPRTLLLYDDPDTLRFEVADTEEAALATMTPKEKGIFDKIKSMKARFTWTEALMVAETRNKKLVSSVLKKAEGHRLVIKTANGYELAMRSEPELTEPS